MDTFLDYNANITHQFTCKFVMKEYYHNGRFVKYVLCHHQLEEISANTLIAFSSYTCILYQKDKSLSILQIISSLESRDAQAIKTHDTKQSKKLVLSKTLEKIAFATVQIPQ